MTTSKDFARIQQLLTERKNREQAALKLFRPMPNQEPFFKSKSMKRIIRGGNRCLGGETEIYDPVAKCSRPVSQIAGEFHVRSYDEVTGEEVIKKASEPFIKAFSAIWKFTLTTGESFTATMAHRVYSVPFQQWMPISEALARRCCLLEPSPGTYIAVDKAEYLRGDFVWDFTVEDTHNYFLAGIVHHNSGKSTSAAVEFASAATKIPLRDSDDNEIPFRYPTDRPLVMWVIGYDLDHLSRNIHRLLFQDGSFKLIKDLETGETRAWRPWIPEELERKKETFNAPALIPERFIDDFAWENKAQRVFKVCRLINGTEIRAFSSMGKEPQGDQCDCVWIDEDVENDMLIMESTARLIDRGGCMFWSAFPKSKNEALRKLSTEAADANPLDPTCTETVLRMSDNPFLDQKALQDFLAGLSDEERRSRDFGEFCDDLVAMFPTFDQKIHGVRSVELEMDAIDKAIRDNGLEPPQDWTRYLVLDPGHARPAVLFMAVPPPHFDVKRQPSLILYDEIAVPRIDAAETARLIVQKTRGQSFEAFIIDGHAGRQTSMGRGETTQQFYSQEFEKRGLRSRSTLNGFVQGSDNVAAGLECIRDFLHINADGRSRLRVVVEKCPNLCKQMELYKKSITNNIVQDKPANNQVDDMVHCLRYGAAFNPQYRKPEKSFANYSPAYRSFLKFMGKKPEDTSVKCGPQYV